MENVNPPPTLDLPVLLTVLRAKVVQELNELQEVSSYIDSRLENIKHFLYGFVNLPNEIYMDDLDPDNESADTPLVSSFLDSDDDSDDGEVLNELEEYGIPLRIDIKRLKNDSDVGLFVNFVYQNKWEGNLYVEHSGYDALDIRDQGETMANDGNESSDAYCSSDEEDLSYVDFQTEVDDNVVIKTVTTNDPFLNKLCADSP
nr:zinc finger, PMZ-type [Tanacetum cinerariifolium]